MSLPVSQYEALLVQVRCLRMQAQQVQQLANPLLENASTLQYSDGVNLNSERLDYTMEPLLLDAATGFDEIVGTGTETDTVCSEEGSIGAHLSVSSEPISQANRSMSTLYHGTWPVERQTMWNSEPTSLGPPSQYPSHVDASSVMSFASSSGGVPLDRGLGSPDDHSRRSSQQLEAKVNMVYSLLDMLGGQEHADMGETLLALSTNPESCVAMRQSGCIPLLVQLVQSDRDSETREKASKALHNLVHSQPDEKLRKRETRILKLLDNSRAYTEALRNKTEYDGEGSAEDDGKHPIQTIAHLMKLSFDEGHRQAICQLGGIHITADLVEVEHLEHGSTTEDSHCILLRRYACMALTNLTFGDSGNKALLCSFRQFIRALVVQLQSPSDELRQVTASVLRNLSWRADATSKEILKDAGCVTGLMNAAMLDNKESTLKSILSALWNLSAHCTENKSEICEIEGALGYLVETLSYRALSNTLAIIENAGGILRNISSQIAVRDDYRDVLRRHNCLQTLLEHLKSPSLTVVSNACGTLWNLSAKNTIDQDLLWQLGAPSMLRSLNHSKHKMIAMGSSAALKNLISARPQQAVLPPMDSTILAMDLPSLPTLGVRKQKALLKDLDQNLSETFDSLDSPKGGALQKTLKNKQNQRESSASPSFLKRSSIDYVARTELNENFNGQFASLSLHDEPSTSGVAGSERKSRFKKCDSFPNNCGATSLPYIKSTPSVKPANSSTFIPVRNKLTDRSYDLDLDTTSDEKPVDFSRKYAETPKMSNVAKCPKSSGSDRDNTKGAGYAKVEDSTSPYEIYAETDLDQPTDYSLRYAEDDSDSESCDSMTKDPRSEYVPDTVKTYCTEGTPYETPFNFSTATSMSDLRIDDERSNVIDNDKPPSSPVDNDKNSIAATSKETTANMDEKDHCSTEEISDTETRQRPPTSGQNETTIRSEFSSGILTPEKPVNYYEEGTPGYFSRVSSCGSIDSMPPNDRIGVVEERLEVRSDRVGKDDASETPKKSSIEAKAVKFENDVNYAEETPLMFSRSSSLASLDSIEQHSIHDDRSSVISDFSRLTSGIVSPSELPDSPTQTVPPSPKPRKISLEYPCSSKGTNLSDCRPQVAPRALPKPNFFEDNVTKFKEESTPVQFSTGTSLSSLTIDDRDDTHAQNISKQQQSQEDNTLQKEEAGEKQDIGREKEDNFSNEELNHGDEDEGDDDILAACINSGMPSNRHNQSTSCSSKLPILGNKLSRLPTLNKTSGSGIPLARTVPSKAFVASSATAHSTPKTPGHVNENADTVRRYSTEDTPAQLSHAGSQSDLSVLSIPNTNCSGRANSRKDYLSDDSSNLSGDYDDILAECIQSGMSKAKREANKPLTQPSANGRIPVVGQSGAPPLRVLRQPQQSPSIVVAPIKYNPINNSVRNTNRQNGEQIIRSNEAVQTPPPRNFIINSGVTRTTYNDTGGPNYKGGGPNYKGGGGGLSLPPYLETRDDVDNYVVEDSPMQFSLRSSLSDLTVDGSVVGLKKSPVSIQVNNEQSSDSASNQHGILNVSEENNFNRRQLSRNASLSDISNESLGSSENEVLLEQCISSGMPRNKRNVAQNNAYDNSKNVNAKYVSRTPVANHLNNEKSVSSASKQPGNFNISENDLNRRQRSRNASLSDISIESIGSLETEQALLEQCISSGMPKSKHNVTSNKHDQANGNKPNKCYEENSKNVKVASVARNTNQVPNTACPDISATAADVTTTNRVEKNCRQELGTPSSNNVRRVTTPPDRHLDTVAKNDENSTTTNDDNNIVHDRLSRSGSNKSFSSSENGAPSQFDDYGVVIIDDRRLERSCGESGKIVDTRMLDPDAMIESLDRFTAELVSQASSHLQNKDCSYKSTHANDNTWNDDTSLNDLEPDVVLKRHNFDLSKEANVDAIDSPNAPESLEPPSIDFSSLSSSTMTASTLIAIEATKIASAFKYEADMSNSMLSTNSLELDQIRPPSNLNSMTNSAVSLDAVSMHSPKLSRRKKSLSSNAMIKKVLTGALNHASSVDSLENAPLDSSYLCFENGEERREFKSNFVLNGAVRELPNSNTSNSKNVTSMMRLLNDSSRMTNSISDLDNINPPSILSQVTDLCNSLADVATSAICSETEIFEDCFTHVRDDDVTLRTTDDVTEFSDANSITPIQSEESSPENTPKKTKNGVTKTMTSKQKRLLARERYKTYTVAAEILTQSYCEENDRKASEDEFKTTNETEEYSRSVCDETFVSPRCSTKEDGAKLTPKERRASDRFRFQTQVLDPSVIPTTPGGKLPSVGGEVQSVETNEESPCPSPTKPKARQNYAQRRLMNRDRFKTQTIDNSKLSPELGKKRTDSTNSDDLHLLVEQEANMVLKCLRETRTQNDDISLLDCETLSLVSNDDELTEPSSGGSANYRTYHKSWGVNNTSLPVIENVQNVDEKRSYANGYSKVNGVSRLATPHSNFIEDDENLSEEEGERLKMLAKPKIVKPRETRVIEQVQPNEDEDKPKGIRGRRKPLYTKTNLNKNAKPIKTIASNLVKNVTATLKSGTGLRQSKIVAKPPTAPPSRLSTGYGNRSIPSNNSPKTSPARNRTGNIARNNNNVFKQGKNVSSPLERQGTFTKDDPPIVNTPKGGGRTTQNLSKIPAPTSTPKNSAMSKLPTKPGSAPARTLFKSSSTDRAQQNGDRGSGDRSARNGIIYNRSTSADSRETSAQSGRRIQSSLSSQSLKSDPGKMQNGGAIKKATTSKLVTPQRSSSNSSLNSNGSQTARKQVTSKIASLWKKIEDSKKQPPKNDKKIWIQAQRKDESTTPEGANLKTSNTCDSKGGVVLRNKTTSGDDVIDTPKRISRLGSFIVMDETDDNSGSF